MSKRLTTAAAILMAAWIAGCGYKFSGGGPMPGNVKRIHVATMENRTTEVGAETIFTNDLIYEMTRSGRVDVTDPQGAEATLRGTIRSISVANIARSTARTAVERRVTVVMEFKLVARDGRVMRHITDLSDDEAFSVAGDRQANDLRRRNALTEISKRMAESVYQRLTEDF